MWNIYFFRSRGWERGYLGGFEIIASHLIVRWSMGDCLGRLELTLAYIFFWRCVTVYVHNGTRGDNMFEALNCFSLSSAMYKAMP